MATQHTVGTIELSPERVSPHASGGALRVLGDYWALTKPEVNFLILITTFAGFYLACKPGTDGLRIFPILSTLFGTLLIASGTGTLNQYLERVPALHGHCLDVSRRLRPRGLPGFTFGRTERSIRSLAKLGCFVCAYPTQLDSGDRRRSGSRIFGRGLHTWFSLFLLLCTVCLSQVKCRGATAARRINHLSSCGFYPDDAG
jgi:hypothetical protein